MIPAVGTPKTDYRNSVRIIGGAWRGRRIAFPDLPGLRPTPDRVRETVFNWLQHFVAGSRCLDLFAGSGALGLEALSRGAREVVFVERAPAAARQLQAQILHLRADASARMLEMDAGSFLRSVPQAFDLVFLDPPFGAGALLEYVALLDAGNWVAGGSLVYLENEKSAGVPSLPPHWDLLKSKFAGEVGYHLARVNRQLQPNE
jgi:16S rRNA (guanine966-N2)-methyltransferase